MLWEDICNVKIKNCEWSKFIYSRRIVLRTQHELSKTAIFLNLRLQIICNRSNVSSKWVQWTIFNRREIKKCLMVQSGDLVMLEQWFTRTENNEKVIPRLIVHQSIFTNQTGPNTGWMTSYQFLLLDEMVQFGN